MTDLSRVQASINSLDLSFPKALLGEPDREGWCHEKIDFMEKQYKNLLFLWYKYPKQTLPPSKDTDVFWHTHILCTKQYTDDMQKIFGRYLHHTPTIESQDDAGNKKFAKAFEETCSLYKKEFGEELWDVEEVEE